MSKLLVLSGDSVIELLGDGGYRAQIALGGAATEENVVGSRNSPLMSKLTPANLP